MTEVVERLKALRERREAARAEGATAVATAERAAQRKQRRSAARRTGSADVRTEPLHTLHTERSDDQANTPVTDELASDEPTADVRTADEPNADQLAVWLPVAAARVSERHAVQPSVGKRLLEHAVDKAIRGGELEQAAFVSESIATLADMEVVALAKAMWRETRARDAAAAARQSHKKPRLHWA